MEVAGHMDERDSDHLPHANVVDADLLARIRLPVYTVARYDGPRRRLRSWAVDDGFRSLGLVHWRSGGHGGTLEVETASYERRASGARRLELPLEVELRALRDPPRGPADVGSVEQRHPVTSTEVELDGVVYPAQSAGAGERWVTRFTVEQSQQHKLVVTMRAARYAPVRALEAARPEAFLD